MSGKTFTVLNYGLDFLLIALIGHYLKVAPFTKVEESFNLQAIYDITNRGLGAIAEYDHKAFPGVVPRTFVGPLIVSLVVWIYKVVVRPFVAVGMTQMDIQVAARTVIGLANAVAFMYLKSAIGPAGWVGGLWFTLFQCGQFHSTFYATRTLPNFMALPFTTVAFAQVALARHHSALFILALCGVVFRAEIGLLALVTLVVVTVAAPTGTRGILVTAARRSGVLLLGVVTGALVSFTVDSYFWGYYVVPEVQSVIFNLVEGRSKEYGIDPFYTYFVKHIPHLYNIPVALLLVLPGFFYTSTRGAWSSMPGARSQPPAAPEAQAKDGTVSNQSVCKTVVQPLVKVTAETKPASCPGVSPFKLFVAIAVLFVLGMSFQPHKEWRFIIYVMPLLTAVGANGAYGCTQKGGILRSLLAAGLVGIAVFNVGCALAMGYISSLNYPAGYALEAVNHYAHHDVVASGQPVTVYIDPGSAMTGASLFGQIPPSAEATIIYDKTEEAEALYIKWPTYDYLLGCDPEDLWLFEAESNWEQVEVIPGFDRFDTEGLVLVLSGWVTQGYVPFGMLWAKVQERQAWVDFAERYILQKDTIFIFRRIRPETISAIGRAKERAILKMVQADEQGNERVEALFEEAMPEPDTVLDSSSSEDDE